MLQKLLVLLVLLGSGSLSGWAQGRQCGTMDHVAKLERDKPNLRQQLKQQARLGQQVSVKDLTVPRPLGEPIVIPVVVHVLYSLESYNISDAQILSQIEVLNKDFRRLNDDAGNTPTMFQGIAADTEIEFRLAQRTPEGEPTKGITRTKTTVDNFKVDDKMKFASSGGKDAWDTRQYLNIWVVRFARGESVLGYAQFPNSGSPLTDGIVIDFRNFGTTPNVPKPFNKGRTATHEVGHWLNLFHIWGDESCGDDQIADTPTQEEENVGCPVTFPLPSCGNVSDMYMNYMDYTDDGCMNAFTKGQATVMRSALARYRPGILTSQGAVPVSVPTLEAALLEFTSPAKVLCDNTFTPVVTLRNKGQATLSTAQLEVKLGNGAAQVVTWTGSLASFQSVAVTLPAQTALAGLHVLSVRILSRNNQPTDSDPTNDQIFLPIQVQGISLPLNEGFEGPAFPPEGWSIVNPDGGISWAHTTTAAKSGTGSAFMNNFGYDGSGQTDDLVLPPLNLTTRTSPRLTFQVAYATYSATGYSDTLEVWASKDCGITFQRVYQKFGADLATVNPTFQESEFIPNATQWRTETVDLEAFASSNTVLIKFRNITDFENHLYLDDVQVNGGPLGTAENLAQQAVVVSPNPTTGIIRIISPEAEVKSLQVLSPVGKVLQSEQYTKSAKGQEIQLSLENQANGVYLIKLHTDKGVVVRRVLLMR